MNQRLTPGTALLLVIPPLLWAGNAVTGRLVSPYVPPLTLNLLRWALAFLLLLPFAGGVLKPSSGLWRAWPHYALLGLLGVGLYNSLQYLALRTSMPINVTLVGASMPVWMMLIGRMFYGQAVTRRQAAGTAVSFVGVLVVLCQGQLTHLAQLRLVVGDVYMLLATIAWSFYSWKLARGVGGPPEIRRDWKAFMLAQIVFGMMWSGAFTAAEWTLGDPKITWGWPLVAGLVYVAAAASVVAYGCWGAGVQRAGPSMAAFFSNLTPLFAAVLSTLLLGQAPRPYHGAAFVLIAVGIAISTRAARPAARAPASPAQ